MGGFDYSVSAGRKGTSNAIGINVQINDTNICKGSIVLLDAGFIGLKYKWSTNDTTQKITILEKYASQCDLLLTIQSTNIPVENITYIPIQAQAVSHLLWHSRWRGYLT